MGGKGGGGDQNLYGQNNPQPTSTEGGWVYADTGTTSPPKPVPVDTPGPSKVVPPTTGAPPPRPVVPETYDLSFLPKNFGHYDKNNLGPLGDALVRGMSNQQGQV